MQNFPTSKNFSIIELVQFLNNYQEQNTFLSKAAVEDAVLKRFGFSKKRSVYICSNFAINFSSVASSHRSFSNTIIALSTLKRYDHIPFLVCVVSPTNINLYLSNTTFLKKISHSSHNLRIDNIKGSFNGSDIVREYNGVQNTPTNFDELFVQHQEFTWEDYEGPSCQYF